MVMAILFACAAAFEPDKLQWLLWAKENLMHLAKPRALGNVAETILDHDTWNTTNSILVRNGILIPRGIWCRASPTCSACLDCKTCPKCTMCRYMHPRPKSRKKCQDKEAPYRQVPFLYTDVLAISTTYLLVQIKMLCILWLPKWIDVVFKVKGMYMQDLKYVQGHVNPRLLLHIMSDNQGKFHKGHLNPIPDSIFKMLPRDLSRKVIQNLDSKSIVTSQQVCKSWNKQLGSNSVWYELYCQQNQHSQQRWLSMAELRKSNALKPNTQHHASNVCFKNEFKQQYEYNCANATVVSYERLCRERDEHQSSQFDQMYTMDGLRRVATVGSIAVGSWQYLGWIIFAVQMITFACTSGMLAYLIVQILYRTPNGATVEHGKLFARMVVLCALTQLVCSLNSELYGSLGKNIKPSKTFAKAATNVASTMVIFFRIATLGLHAGGIILSFRHRRITRLLIVSIFAVAFSEGCFYHWQVSTPIITSILSGIYPSAIASLRVLPCVLATLFSTSTLFRQVFGTNIWLRCGFTFSSVFWVDLILTKIGLPYPLLAYVAPRKELIADTIKFLMGADAMIRVFLYASWYFVKEVRLRKKLKFKEQRELAQTLLQFGMVEAIMKGSGVKLALRIASILFACIEYMHWSKSITLLAIMHIKMHHKFPRFSTSHSAKHHYWVMLTSVALISHDMYFDLQDQPSMAQPYLSIVWIGGWILY